MFLITDPYKVFNCVFFPAGKFNNAEFSVFDSSLKENISQSKIDYCNIEDKSLKWDLTKMEIRAFTIRYSKRKASFEEKEILDAINACQKKLDKQKTNDAIKNEINSLKQKLEKILEEKIKGTILRSKTRWYEDGTLAA